MIEQQFDKKTKSLTLKLKGRFDYSCHAEFKEAFISTNTVQSYVVDMEKVTYLDSSALGMLLLLRDHAGGEKAIIRLVNVNSSIIDILKIANFHKLFEVFE